MNRPLSMSEATVSQSTFARRIAEFQNAAELAQKVAGSLEHIERKLLGPRSEPQSGEDRPAFVGGSLNDELEMYADHIRRALERLSASTERLHQEMVGVPEEQPVDDQPQTGSGGAGAVLGKEWQASPM